MQQALFSLLHCTSHRCSGPTKALNVPSLSCSSQCSDFGFGSAPDIHGTVSLLSTIMGCLAVQDYPLSFPFTIIVAC